jgi:hypothetical protein
MNSGGGVTLTTTGAGSNLTLGGDLSAPSQTVTLSSAGTITQHAPIAAQNLVARTQSDAGAALTLTDPANDVPGNVTLSALNTAGAAPAAGAIDFVDSTGFTVATRPANGLNGQEIGVNTTADVTMQAGGEFLSTGGGSSTLTVGGMISSGAGVIALAAGTGGISITGSIAKAGSTASTSTGLGLFSTGPIIENATGIISVPYLLGLTENNAGAQITLTGAGNSVDAVTLSTLNGPGNPAGPIAAPGKISFADSKGFQILPVVEIGNFDRDLMVLRLTPAEVSALTAQAFGINTSGDAFLSSVSATSAFITTNAGGRISAANLVVRSQSDLGQEINLTNPQNTVRGNVTLSALNTAGNAPASGAIDFVDSTGFTVAGQPGNGLNGQEIGVNTTSDINLVTRNSGSNLTLAGIVSAPGHMVTLTSAGTIAEQSNATITAGTLTGSSAGNASFAQPGNLVANLGAFTTTTGGNNGNFALTNGQALNITGLLNTGTGAVTLTSAGTIAEPAGGLITAGTLTGSSAGGASLTQANQVATFGPFNNTTSGLLSFTDSQPLMTAGAVNSAGGLTLTTTGGSNLTLGANLTASGQVTLNSAGNITEVNDPVVTAPGLTVGAAGKVSLGIDGSTVFPANANMVDTLTGTAGGTFGFLNAKALTIGTITESGGDVLIQVNNVGQPLTLAGNINVTAGGRVILDTAGGFSQTGTATVNAPVLAIDTTGSGVNTLLGFITSPSVNASVVSNLPPAGKTSNPIQFGNLSAPSAVVLLFADQGSVSGPIQAGQLGLSGTGSLADLQGSINGVSGPTAALLGVRAPGPDPTYLFNDCIIAASTCVVIPPNQLPTFLVTQPQAASEIQALSVSPNLSAQFVLIEPQVVKGVRQSEDPDAPVINIFDEERLCDETAKSQPTKEPCREER